MSKRQAERYVAAVYKLWREQSGEDRRLKISRAMARRQEVFFHALKKNDYASANKALDALERLEGFTPEMLLKLHHTTEVEQEDESERRISEMIREVMSEKETRHAFVQKLIQAREREKAEHTTSRDTSAPNLN